MPSDNIKRIGKITRITLFLTVLMLGGAIYLTADRYNKAVSAITAAESEVHAEIIRATAPDGVPLKALLLLPPNYSDYTERSIPLLIGCHGMSSEFYQGIYVYSTLLKYGFAILAPEFRGHMSNPAPTTLGSKEPLDIIILMNKVLDKYTCISDNKMALYGESMGGLYSTLLYILDAPHHRFKALVDLCGPVNLSREIDDFTDRPDILGNIGFTSNLTGKNPVGLPGVKDIKNVMIAHSEDDNIVVFNCSVDFYRLLDPYDNRTDVVFYRYNGRGHSVGRYEDVQKNSVAWILKWTLGLNVTGDDIEISDAPYSLQPMHQFKASLLLISRIIMLLIPQIFIIINPGLIKAENSFRKGGLHTGVRGGTITKIFGNIYGKGTPGKIIFFTVYVLLCILSWAISLPFNGYIVNELIIPSLILGGFTLAVLFSRKDTDDKNGTVEYIYKLINPRYAAVWILGIWAGALFYPVVSCIPAVEDGIMLTGARLTVWLPYFAFIITVLAVLPRIFISAIFGWKQPGGKRKITEHLMKIGIGALFTFILTFITLNLFWLDKITVFFNWDYINLHVYLVPAVALGMGLIFAVLDIFSMTFGKIIGSYLVPTHMFAVYFAFFIGCSRLIFIA